VRLKGGSSREGLGIMEGMDWACLLVKGGEVCDPHATDLDRMKKCVSLTGTIHLCIAVLHSGLELVWV
jgi:hypothetical protein